MHDNTVERSTWQRIKRFIPSTPKDIYFSLRIIGVVVVILGWQNFDKLAIIAHGLLGMKQEAEKVLIEVEKTQTKIEDAEKKLQELEENQPAIIRKAAEKMNAELCEEANFLQKALTPVCNSSTTSTKASDEAVSPASVSTYQTPSITQKIDPPVMSIKPSAPLNDDDIFIERENSKLYMQEKKRSPLLPNSE